MGDRGVKRSGGGLPGGGLWPALGPEPAPLHLCAGTASGGIWPGGLTQTTGCSPSFERNLKTIALCHYVFNAILCNYFTPVVAPRRPSW